MFQMTSDGATRFNVTEPQRRVRIAQSYDAPVIIDRLFACMALSVSLSKLRSFQDKCFPSATFNLSERRLWNIK